MLSAIDRTALRRLLARGTWFSGLPARLQLSVVDAAERRSFDTGQMLYRCGEPSRGFWMLIQGQVMIARISRDGDRFLLHIGGPGLCFGAAAALTDTLTSVEVTAATRVQVLLIPTPALQALVTRAPELHRYFDDLIVQHYRTTLQSLAESRTLPPEAYLLACLARLARQWRQDGYQGPTIDLALTQADAAHLLGVSRQTVNRYLSRLENLGLVEVAFRSIRILSPDGLPTVAQGEPRSRPISA